jgi:hypothetical protein
MSTLLELYDLETPAIPQRQLETLLDLYDGSLAELKRLEDPAVANLIRRLERRRDWARVLLDRAPTHRNP